jgi:hypothetical protein
VEKRFLVACNLTITFFLNGSFAKFRKFLVLIGSSGAEKTSEVQRSRVLNSLISKLCRIAIKWSDGYAE